ncbi:MAG: hypothetical protein JSW34_10385 [Candidatus Zixiibacteriota bacterium]|nr:MAG: hypothetical protein JSW34_10385 [candidate division Zixibacteria bacterium]
MSRKLVLLVLLLLSLAMTYHLGCVCVCEPPATVSLAVTIHPQETAYWCWAASGQMVMDYLGHDVSQCTQVNDMLGRTDCCTSPVPGGCLTGGWPDFARYGFTFDRTSDAALSWAEVQEQISTSSYCKKKPFCFTWHWDGGGGHMMVAMGYTTIDTTNWVEMIDPWPPNVGDQRFITYNAYVSGSHYTHWDDFYNITYTGGS